MYTIIIILKGRLHEQQKYLMCLPVLVVVELGHCGRGNGYLATIQTTGHLNAKNWRSTQ